MSMENKTSDVVNNICTVIGAAFLLKPIIDEAAKTLAPEMQKLTSGKAIKEIQLLSDKEDKRGDFERETEREPHNEIAELKRKLAELEEKKEFPYDKQEG